MDRAKRQRLEADGWRVGSADEFLELSALESTIVNIKLLFGRALKTRRAEAHLSQQELATLIESSQSRVAKMEAADPEVSLDLLLRGLLATGATPKDLGKIISSTPVKAATPRRPSKPGAAARQSRARAAHV